MLTFGGRRIYLAAGATDMRKSFNGLAGVVRDRLDADPMSRHLFLFCNGCKFGSGQLTLPPGACPTWASSVVT